MNTDYIKKCLIVHKPKLTENSIKTYLYIMKMLYESYLLNDKHNKYNKNEINPSFLLDVKNVMKIINSEKKLNTQKSELSVCYIFVKACFQNELQKANIYHDEMMKLSKEYNEWLKKQEKSETQKQNWIDRDELDKIINDLFNEVKDYKELDILTKEQYKNLEVYVLLRLLDNFSIRNEYGNMKLINKEPFDNFDNYLVIDKANDTYKIILNIYKTKKYLGKKQYYIPENIKKFLKILLSFNKSGYLLSNIKNTNALGRNGLTLLLTRFFKKKTGKNISTSMIRHIQATDDLEDEESIIEKQNRNKQIEDKYLHNSRQHELYAKKDN